MDSGQFIIWLQQLVAQDVGKVVPNDADLVHTYQRMRRLAAVQAAIDAAVMVAETTMIAIPDNLAPRVQDAIQGTDIPWDQALWQIAQNE